jgi:hypothetical protein
MRIIIASIFAVVATSLAAQELSTSKLDKAKEAIELKEAAVGFAAVPPSDIDAIVIRVYKKSVPGVSDDSEPTSFSFYAHPGDPAFDSVMAVIGQVATAQQQKADEQLAETGVVAEEKTEVEKEK